MRKYILILSGILLVAMSAFAGNNNDRETLREHLVRGKWMTRSDGYYAMPVRDTIHKDIPTVKRYKTLNFKADSTFSMDSAKKEYLGKYYINDRGKITLVFNGTKVIHFGKVVGQSSASYTNTPEIVTPCTRDCFLTSNGDLVVKNCGSNFAEKYVHHNNSVHGLLKFYEFSGFANATSGHLIMLLVAFFFIFLAIRFKFEPMLLIPIGIGIIIGNIPMFQAVDFNLQLGIYEPGSVMNFFYSGVVQGWFPPLIFLGIGAMTDFSALISSPRLMLLGAAAQFGVFATFLLALCVGFYPAEAGAIGIIGGADGPTAIFLSSKLANGLNIVGFDAASNPILCRNLIGPIAIAAYSYMALVPVIQPPIVKLMTTRKERMIKMRAPRAVSKIEKILFPIVGLLLTAYISPTSLPLLGMLFFGNLMKECGVVNRLANTASNPLIDTITILLGVTVGASTQADVFLTTDSIMIFAMGALSFILATAFGVFFAKIMNWCSPKSNPVNPIIGCAGVSAVPDSARVAQELGHKADPTNYLLMHAMAPNVAGVIGSAIAAGILLSFLM